MQDWGLTEGPSDLSPSPSSPQTVPSMLGSRVLHKGNTRLRVRTRGKGAGMTSLRIAYFVNIQPRKLGTAENHIVAFAREAARRGHEFTLFSWGPVHRAVRLGIEEAGGEIQPLERVRDRPIRAARRLSKEFDVIELNLVSPRSRIAIATYLAWPCRILFVDRVSGPIPGSVPTQSKLESLVDRFTLARVSSVAGITDYVRRRAQARYRLSEAQTCTIYHGVDTDRFHPPVGGRAHGEVLRIAVVANLIPEKGIHVLLEALASLRDIPWRLAIAGDGPESAKLQELARQLGLDSRVEFLGLQDDIPALLQRSDVMVHPALWEEALGNTILEGLATGCVVIASRVGGIPELINDGVTGILVPPGQSGALADALRLVHMDRELRARIQAAARSHATTHFSLEASVARHLDWCEQHAAPCHRGEQADIRRSLGQNLK